MTKEEAKEILEEVKDLDDSMYQYISAYEEALDMAIKALSQEPKTDVLDKIRAEIEEIEKNYGLDKATKYGNKNAEQQSLSYSTMMMYEIADIIDEIKEIIDKHIADMRGTE